MSATRSTPINQLGLGLNLSTKKTRKAKFLDELERVVPWSAQVEIGEPHRPSTKNRPTAVRGGDDAAHPLSAIVVLLV